MERDGIFKAKKDSAKADKGMMLQQVQREEEPEGMYYQGCSIDRTKDKDTIEETRVVISAMFAGGMGIGSEIVKVIEVEELEITEMTGMREKIETTGTTCISIGPQRERDMTQAAISRRGQCFMMKVSDTPEENPRFPTKVGGKEIDFLIDSGAIIPAVRNKQGPSNGETVATVALDGILIHEELSEPLPVSV
ncbi:hypothetical protein NDU88_001279 [Pleurodeles waltl]|uniref:Uncharacterized protein n=1 Tax=Pleurodeles waltl TaxID=8319 RepID=A0AAV7P3N9_PLEWA|nr:hypothetical protein NDU88_001279 [Pleurodeles waltl]